MARMTGFIGSFPLTVVARLDVSVRAVSPGSRKGEETMRAPERGRGLRWRGNQTPRHPMK